MKRTVIRFLLTFKKKADLHGEQYGKKCNTNEK